MRGVAGHILGLFASPGGIIVLAALDSTLFFSLPFGIDAVVVILTARMQGMAWVVPLLATAGSVAGAALTFWMGATIGDAGLERFVEQKRIERVRRKVKNSGAVTLAILDLIPPPFPFTPFVLAAGALEVRASMFFSTLVACRLLRFGVEAYLATIYGRRILSWLDSDLFREIVFATIVLAVILTALSIVRLVKSTRTGRPVTKHRRKRVAS